MNRRSPVALLVGASLLMLSPHAAARPQGQRSLASEVKAQFVYNFLDFIEWPASAFARADEPFRVCVAADPVSDMLIVTVRGGTVGGRKVLVERLRDESESGACRVLFVPEEDEIRLPTLMRATAKRGVLVIGESQNVLDACGSIALVIEDGRVRFDVNMAAVRSQNLKVSSKLLRLARGRVDTAARCGS